MPDSSLHKFFDHLRGFFTEPPLASAESDADAGPPAISLSGRGASHPRITAPAGQGLPDGKSAVGAPIEPGLPADLSSVASAQAETFAKEEARPPATSLPGRGASHPRITAPAGQGFPDGKSAVGAPIEPGLPAEARGAKAGSPEEQSFADRVAELEKRIDALTPATSSPLESARRTDITAFVESLRAAGKFPPAFDRLGVTDFLHHLAAIPSPASVSHPERPVLRSLGEGGSESSPEVMAGQGFLVPSEVEGNPAIKMTATAVSSEGVRGKPQGLPAAGGVSPVIAMGDGSPLAWFREFLTQLPQVIDFGELTAAADSPVGARSVIRFAEPRRGVEIDPESVVMAERAETLSASEGITYAEALTRLRREHHSNA